MNEYLISKANKDSTNIQLLIDNKMDELLANMNNLLSSNNLVLFACNAEHGSISHNYEFYSNPSSMGKRYSFYIRWQIYFINNHPRINATFNNRTFDFTFSEQNFNQIIKSILAENIFKVAFT